MDTIDRQMLSRLKTDGRASITTLAVELGITRATVKARLDKLKSSGMIRKFTVELDDTITRDTIRAVTLVEVQGNLARPVIRRLRSTPQITRLYTTNGTWDLVAEIEVNTLPEFEKVLTGLREIPGILNSETCLLLDTAKG